MYQVGQAVIYWGKHFAFFHTNYDPHYGYTLQDFNGKLSYCHSIDRPATEAEILAEAVKHGWKERQLDCLESELDYFELRKNKVWEWISFPPTLQENLKEYCEEGLIAHRLITALNLAK